MMITRDPAKDVALQTKNGLNLRGWCSSSTGSPATYVTDAADVARTSKKLQFHSNASILSEGSCSSDLLCILENFTQEILPEFPDTHEHISQPFRCQMPEEYDMECDICEDPNK